MTGPARIFQVLFTERMMSNKQRIIILAALFLILIVFVISIPDTSDSAPKKPTEYIVKPGDTCNQIAYKFNVPVKIITDYNGMNPDCKLFTGQLLYIPAP
jgi:LysM repeat protein